MSTMSLPAQTFGADYAAANAVSPTELRAAGAGFVCRYLSVSSSSWKVITAGERDEIFAAGLGLLLNWEVGSNDWEKASEAASWGRQAAEQAEALGYPTSLPIIASIDTGLTGSQVGQGEQYLNGFAAALGGYPLGVYGASPIINAMAERSVLNWATNATSWGHDYDRTPNIQQHTNSSSRYPQFAALGTNIDVDETLTAITVWGGGTGGSTASGSATAATYTVAAGDSWWSIAAKELGSGSKDAALASFNGKTIDDTLVPGEVLKIPSS